MVLTGVVAGALAAVAAIRLLVRVVEGVSGADPKTFALMVLVLIAVAMFASFFPARHGSRTDPMRALRQD
jgi:putative ABC transport system permease protein